MAGPGAALALAGAAALGLAAWAGPGIRLDAGAALTSRGADAPHGRQDPVGSPSAAVAAAIEARLTASSGRALDALSPAELSDLKRLYGTDRVTPM
jgi:hypothetical protein